jgi:hypothetical protein
MSVLREADLVRIQRRVDDLGRKVSVLERSGG